MLSLALLSLASADVPTTVDPLKLVSAPPAITHNPLFLKVPDWRRIAQFYPSAADAYHQTGSAEVSCKVDQVGMITACSVVSEQPAGLGFGKAAADAALQTMGPLSPAMIDGKAVPFDDFRIRLNFQSP